MIEANILVVKHFLRDYENKFFGTWDMRIPYQLDLTLTNSRIRSIPSLDNTSSHISSALIGRDPLLLGHLSDDLSGPEFLDDSHGVHLPSGSFIAHRRCRTPSKKKNDPHRSESRFLERMNKGV
jgi:hypothetical protein